MHLNEIKMVDLVRTEWNKSLSDPKNGKYSWEGQKVYIVQDKSTYGDANLRPDHVLRWVAADEDEPANDNRETYRWDYQAEEVKVEDELYYPEPMKPDVNGHYRFKDMMLMQIPLPVWVAKMEADQKRANTAVQQERGAFESMTRAEGAETPESNVYETESTSQKDKKFGI
jgi:hypothetical protein